MLWAVGVRPSRMARQGGHSRNLAVPPLEGELRGGGVLARREVRPAGGANGPTPEPGVGERGLLVSVGGSCPQIPDETYARCGKGHYDEEFHDGSLLGAGM
jgi:hypothetical protein